MPLEKSQKKFYKPRATRYEGVAALFDDVNGSFIVVAPTKLAMDELVKDYFGKTVERHRLKKVFILSNED